MAKLRTISLLEWGYLFSALVLLPPLRAMLRVLGFRRVYAILGRTSPVPDNALSDHNIDDAKSIARMVNLAARRGVVGANCLPRSMATWWLLRWRGLDGEIRIGVATEGNVFGAHAWVECDGVVVNDADDVHERFATFEHIPAIDRMKWQ